jgi:hypothetical protein
MTGIIVSAAELFVKTTLQYASPNNKDYYLGGGIICFLIGKREYYRPSSWLSAVVQTDECPPKRKKRNRTHSEVCPRYPRP